jgi:hypothetical protein
MGGRKNRHYVEIENVDVVPPSTPEEVKALLSQAMADVRTRKLDPRIASALTYMASVLLRAIDSIDVHRRLCRLEAEREGKEESNPSLFPKSDCSESSQRTASEP